MKITRRQLRQIINEAILKEAEFETRGLGKYGRGAGLGIGTTLGAISGGGPGSWITTPAGAWIGSKISDKIANAFGYLAGEVPDNHPLFPKNLYLEYGSEFNNANELEDYLTSIEQGKFKTMYHLNDFEHLGEVAAETLKFLGELGRVYEGLDAVMATVGQMKSKGAFGGFGLGDKKTRGRLGSYFDQAKEFTSGFFGSDDDDTRLT